MLSKTNLILKGVTVAKKPKLVPCPGLVHLLPRGLGLPASPRQQGSHSFLQVTRKSQVQGAMLGNSTPKRTLLLLPSLPSGLLGRRFGINK